MRELDIDKPNEGIDYDLEAVSHGGDAMWNVNIYRAPYNDVTIRYRNVVIDEEVGGINFNFDVIDTPDESKCYPQSSRYLYHHRRYLLETNRSLCKCD